MTEDDELCKICSTTDLYSLFTGPRYFPGDGYGDGVLVALGTLKEVKANTRCPLCRLVNHIIYSGRSSHPWEFYGDEPDSSKVRCNIRPVRADYHEEMKYISERTREMVATKVEVLLSGTENCTQQESEFIRRHERDSGIQLLSPGSVHPTRPLINGHKATTIENSLTLLSKWIKTCQERHHNTCPSRLLPQYESVSELRRILIIDIGERKIVEKDLNSVSYAALSYVWGQDQKKYSSLRKHLDAREGHDGQVSIPLPRTIPGLIEDAFHVCRRLSIPFLWIDLYCVHQDDPTRKSLEINAMGHIYRHSTITLIVGSGHGLTQDTEMTFEHGLLPADRFDALQKIETVSGKQYISAMPPIMEQVQASEWHTRGWTMQEGQLAPRIAFFGDYDLSFMCAAGHWRESFSSGPYGHSADMHDLDVSSVGHHVLSAQNWLSSANWDFEAYHSILMAYTYRKLSFESDRLSAIMGCLGLIKKQKGVDFVEGLPSRDFHFALLWTGEYDRPKHGFPSWSWAGWHALQQSHIIYPMKGTSGTLICKDNIFEHHAPATQEIELQGLLISLAERPHRFNRCISTLAKLGLDTSTLSITITSEVAAFDFDIIAHYSEAERSVNEDMGYIAGSFDSRVEPERAWDPDTEYKTPYDRLLMRDSSNNIYKHYYPRWYDHPPYFKIALPRTLRGSTLTWLLRDGIELIKILEVELIAGADDLEHFHHILCLGIDKSQGFSGMVHRMGTFCMPNEQWVKANPQEKTVQMV